MPRVCAQVGKYGDRLIFTIQMQIFCFIFTNNYFQKHSYFSW